MESLTLRPEPPDAFRIRRKPVSNPNLRATAVDHQSPITSSPALVAPSLSQPPSYSDLFGSAQQRNPPELPQRPRTAGPSSSSSSSTSLSPTPPPPQPPLPTPIQRAYGEARHFLGGLINHPTESNKHFTILRHSHGLVFYRGNATSIAVSIFSDSPLPIDRTIWLQSKGWSGKTGMRTKALFRLNDSWLDVTPVMPLREEQVKPDDERAWQRDIKKFRKKAPPRPRDKHHLRETAVVRIPAEAGDGYFQLVLCQGAKKKVLANSPVFRVLSTSANPHSIRGASLSTLPLEVGAMVVSLYAQTAARTAAAPASAALATRVDRYRPTWVKQTAVQKVYSTSGVEARVAGLFTSTSTGTGQAVPADGSMSPISSHEVSSIIEEGPQAPFPMTFKARSQLGHSSLPSSPSDTTRLTLTSTPDWVLEQLRGYFFGWAKFEVNTEKGSPLPCAWSPMILAVRTLDPLQAARVDMSQISKHVVTLRLLDDMPLQVTKVQVRVMGFLRVEVPPPRGSTSQELADAQAAAAEAAMLADVYDADVVQNTLAHLAWSPETPSAVELQKQNSSWVERTREGYTTIRAKGEKWVERVPLHKLGVRSTTDEWRERQVAVNGFYIVR